MAQLIQQVNRFGPGAPAAWQVVSAPYPVVTGKISPDVALSATVIYQRRATQAYEQFHDRGSEQAIAKANAGFADPVAFVTGNLAEVTQAIAGLADSVGLPGPTAATLEPGATDILAGVPLPLLVVGGVIVFWAVTR